MVRAVGGVHVQKVCGEDGGFAAAGAGADLDQAGEGGEGVRGQEGFGEGGGGGFELRSGVGEVVDGEAAELGICA